MKKVAAGDAVEYAETANMISRLNPTENNAPQNCTRLGSMFFFGASPITSPTRHQELPTITSARMPNAGVVKNGTVSRYSKIC